MRVGSMFRCNGREAAVARDVVCIMIFHQIVGLLRDAVVERAYSPLVALIKVWAQVPVSLRLSL